MSTGSAAGHKESTGGSLGMDTREQYTTDILKCDYEDQNDKLWMDNMQDIAGQLDWDDSDPEMMGASKPATKSNDVQAASCKNLHSERKRRKKLNDAIYALRSAVPKISKMDKESTIGDAISYVLDLQKMVQEIEAEIDGLFSSNKAHDHHTQIAAETMNPLTKFNPELEKLSKESCHGKKLVDRLENGKVLHRKFVEICNTGKERIYHVRIECKKDASVLVDLTRAFECYPLEIMHSNMCCFHEVIHYTLYVRSLENAGLDKLQDMIGQTITRECTA